MGPYPLRRCGSHPVPSQCPLLGGGGAVHIPLPPPDCCRNLFSPRCAPHPRPHAPPAPQLSTLCCLAGAFCFWGASSALLPYPVGNPLGNGDPHTFPPPPPPALAWGSVTPSGKTPVLLYLLPASPSHASTSSAHSHVAFRVWRAGLAAVCTLGVSQGVL